MGIKWPRIEKPSVFEESSIDNESTRHALNKTGKLLDQYFTVRNEEGRYESTMPNNLNQLGQQPRELPQTAQGKVSDLLSIDQRSKQQIFNNWQDEKSVLDNDTYEKQEQEDSLYQPSTDFNKVAVKTNHKASKMSSASKKHAIQPKKGNKKKLRKESTDESLEMLAENSKYNDELLNLNQEKMTQKVQQLMRSQTLNKFKKLGSQQHKNFNPDADIIWISISDQEYVEKYGEEGLATFKETSDDESPVLKKACSKKKVIKKMRDDIYSVQDIERINQELFITLEKEKKARFNWRKVMTMI